MRYPLLLSLAASVLLAACSRAEPPPEPIRSVRTLTVSSSESVGTQEYAGEVRARTESRLGFRIGGKIVRRAVDVGDKVKAGQLLAQLDPQDLKLGQEAARASLSAAQANLDQAQADFKRFKELRDQGFISSAELERRETALKSARAQFEQARAQSNVQGNQAAYASLLADADGVITSVEAEPGMVVAAGAPVVRLAQDGPRDVVFAVPENKLAAIKAIATERGRLAVRLWGDSGAPQPVSLREIGAAADPLTRTFQVKADMGAGQAVRQLGLGRTATVVAQLPSLSGATKLPLSALRESRGETTVWVVEPGAMTVKPRAVKVVGAQGNDAVITGGLAPGDIVVTAGVHVLNPGQKVKFFAEPQGPLAQGPGTPVTVR